MEPCRSVVEGLQFDIRHLALSVAHRQEWLRDVCTLLIFPLQFKEKRSGF